jgi:hypothetical protein
MKHRYARWTTAIALVAGVAMLGCSSSDDDSGVGSGTGGGSPITGVGSGGVGSGTGGMATMPNKTGTGGTMSGSGGATMPGGTGGTMSGSGGAAMMGTGGTMSGTGGSMGDAGPMMGDGGPTLPAAGSCGPPNTNNAVDLGDPMKPGPWTPMHVENTGPQGQSWVFYPDPLGKDGLKHPVFDWGPGAGTGPAEYTDHLNLLASQGFVIISQSSTMSGKEALDWILAENEKSGSMWEGKLDPDRVSRGGHSMGALQSMSESMDPRLKLTVLVCGGAGGGGGAANINYPSIFLGGEGEGGTMNFVPDYGEVTGLSIFITKTSTDHIYCARNNLAPWVAFMRWQLCGEEQWKKEFMPDGTYCKSPWLACMTKGF